MYCKITLVDDVEDVEFTIDVVWFGQVILMKIACVLEGGIDTSSSAIAGLWTIDRHGAVGCHGSAVGKQHFGQPVVKPRS